MVRRISDARSGDGDPWHVAGSAAAAGFLLNDAILVAPLVVSGGWGAMMNPAVVVFLLAAGALFVADLGVLRYRSVAGCSIRAVAAGGEGRPRAPTRLGSGLRPGLGVALMGIDRDAMVTVQRRWCLLCGIVLLLLFWIALVERGVRGDAALNPVGVSGAVLMFCGVGLRLSAIRALGPQFRNEVRTERDGQLVRSGIYRVLRHPSELANLLVALGCVLLLQSMVAAAVWVVMFLPVVLVRVRQEARLLRGVFGSEFEQYVDEVGGLAPGFRRFREPHRPTAVSSRGL